MQIDASFHDHQTEPSAGNLTHVRAAMESFIQVRTVILRDADTLILDFEDHVGAIAG